MVDTVPDLLRRAVDVWPRGRPCHAAFSGGIDSTVLLHGLLRIRDQLPGPLSAIHVDHGLHADSGRWDAHCRDLCRDWQLPYRSGRVADRPAPGHSPEEWAREARYRMLEQFMEPGAIVVTAHQQDDQSETMLLQLCRGAGPAGLSAMPALRPFGSGFIARPLLECSRGRIADYAVSEGLHWIDDPGNTESRYDRNFVRRELVPALRRRWPAIGTTLGRAAELQAETLDVLGEVGSVDLAACRGGAPSRLRLQRLRACTWPRQANVLRHWIELLGLPPPSRAHLQALRAQMELAREDANPLVTWPGAELRLFSGEIWAAAPLAPTDARESLLWAVREPCLLSHGRLSARVADGTGLRRESVPGEIVEVRLRRGGEWLRPAGDGHRRELRKLFQAVRMPPWLRERQPILYIGGKLAAVPGLCVDEEFAASGSEPGWELDWQDVDAQASL